MNVLRSYAGLGALRTEDGVTRTADEDLFRLFSEGIHLVGTPESVVETIRRYADAGVTDLNFRVLGGQTPLDVARRSLELFRDGWFRGRARSPSDQSWQAEEEQMLIVKHSEQPIVSLATGEPDVADVLEGARLRRAPDRRASSGSSRARARRCTATRRAIEEVIVVAEGERAVHRTTGERIRRRRGRDDRAAAALATTGSSRSRTSNLRAAGSRATSRRRSSTTSPTRIYDIGDTEGIEVDAHRRIRVTAPETQGQELSPGDLRLAEQSVAVEHERPGRGVAAHEVEGLVSD